MEKLQFRVLYRHFLFRIVDVELVSQQGDASKLLGQFRRNFADARHRSVHDGAGARRYADAAIAVLSYFRALRMAVEAPDIVSRARAGACRASAPRCKLPSRSSASALCCGAADTARGSPSIW